MKKKIKIAFIKYSGLSSGGTEKQLIRLAVALNKDIFDVDYYWCHPGVDLFSDAMSNPTSIIQKKYLEDNGVKTIKFKVKERDISTSTHKWINTNFWKMFDYKKYDIIQTAKAGHPEYPFIHIPKSIIEWNIFGSIDFSGNIYRTVCISKWIYDIWISNGGNPEKGGIIYPGILESVNPSACNKPFSIKNELTLGFHQRPSNDIFSPIPLSAFSKLKNKIKHKKLNFIILGGGDLYKKQAENLGISDSVKFFNPIADWRKICEFLLSLDIYCHGRKDGECHGTAIQEAMLHGLPVVSHKALMNGHIEIIGDCGKVCNDEKGYEEYLTKLILNNDLRIELGDKARKLAIKEYLVNNTKNKFEKLYVDAISNIKGIKKCSQIIPEGGYRNPNILIILFYRVKYCFLNPQRTPFIIKKTFVAFFTKLKVFLNKIFNRNSR